MRWHTVAARLAVGFASLALLGGCSAGATPSPTPVPTPALISPSTSPPPSTPASPPPTSTPTPSSAATAPATATGSPTDSFVGHVVNTLADSGLRVRSEPRVSDDSHMEEPLLPLGTQLYVLDGPVSASGYAWYEVVPLTSSTPCRAAGSRVPAGTATHGSRPVTSTVRRCRPTSAPWRPCPPASGWPASRGCRSRSRPA